MSIAGRGTTTMTKKPSPRHILWFGWKLLILLSLSFCLFALLRLHFLSDYYPRPSSFYRPRSLIVPFHGPPKIAFLFLVRKDLPLDFLWATFFENADAAKFSIFIHSSPGFQFDDSTTRSHFFYGRQLKNSIQVVWGESSMIEAERLLLSSALEGPANQIFVLLSDSCVPLHNFSYIYSYVMASPKSFVDSFFDTKEDRYNKKMSPIISKNNFRKGSQWITLIRRHAEVIVDDEILFPIFQKYCRRAKLPPLDAIKGKLDINKLKKQNNCIPDEHYVQTLLSVADLEGEIERRTLTYTMWNVSVTRSESKGWHPITFTYAKAGPQKIREIKAINHVYYDTEFRTEWCRSNSTSVPCFLFARKFSRGAAMRLLIEGVISPFNASSLLAASN